MVIYAIFKHIYTRPTQICFKWNQLDLNALKRLIVGGMFLDSPKKSGSIFFFFFKMFKAI